jgi:hypothetical protein
MQDPARPDPSRPSSAADAPPAYTGIGSRRAPPNALALMEALAERLAGAAWTLRTGLSPGADQAFYRGALRGGGAVELYLPCPGFEAGARLEGGGEKVHVLSRPSSSACELAARFHPSWERLSAGERRLLARDAHEVLGADLRSPSRFVACWTPDGSLDGARLFDDGTGQALRIASDAGIPVFNLARPEHVRELSGRWPPGFDGQSRPPV